MATELTVDARWLRTGIGRYTQALLDGLPTHLPGIAHSCIVQPQDAALVSGFTGRVTTCSAGIYGLREQFALPRIVSKASALYVPHYNIPILWRGQLLVTIHDLNHLLDAGYRHTWRARLYARPMLAKAAREADVIITPSHYTKQRLYEAFGTEPSRVRVIPCSVSPCFTPNDKRAARARVAMRHNLREPFLLFVGNCAPNKNLPLLLSAFAALHAKRADAPRLVIVGQKGNSASATQRLLHSLHLQPHVLWLAGLTDAALADLYRAATMTILPSFEEGFGLPIIESMACGTPVLCASAASLPEVAGDAAMYFSPYSSEELTSAMETLMDSTSTHDGLVQAGIARAALFSQEVFSQKQASAIRSVLSN